MLIASSMVQHLAIDQSLIVVVLGVRIDQPEIKLPLSIKFNREFVLFDALLYSLIPSFLKKISIHG